MDGAHTHGGGAGEGLGLVLAAGLAAVAVVAVVPLLVAIVHALLIIVLAVIGLAAVSGTLLVAYRIRRGPSVPPWQHGIRQAPPRQVAATPRRALDPPREQHIHFHGMSPEDVAGVIRRQENQP